MYAVHRVSALTKSHHQAFENQLYEDYLDAARYSFTRKWLSYQVWACVLDAENGLIKIR